MKIILVLLLLCVPALSDTTNTISVVLTADQMANLILANNTDNMLRTNGLGPYPVATNALTLLQYGGSIAPLAIDAKLPQVQAEREALFLYLYRNASVAKQNAALNALK